MIILVYWYLCPLQMSSIGSVCPSQWPVLRGETSRVGPLEQTFQIHKIHRIFHK